MEQRGSTLQQARPSKQDAPPPAGAISSPAIFEDDAARLLPEVDVVRDPLHGDIRLTALERFIVDTPEFQRLRNIHQLALASVVYPGAVHDRFLHALGTLHVCSRMIATCDANAKRYRCLAGADDPVPLEIGAYPTLLARLCALLHGMVHIPFGHALEDEGQVFAKKQWQDPERRELVLSPASPLAAHLRGFFEDHGLPATTANGVLADVTAVLMAKREQVPLLRYPFVHDLVCGTICADVVDHVGRDVFFCGLGERRDERVIGHLGVVPVRIPRERGGESRQDGRPFRAFEPTAFARQEGGSVAELCRMVLLRYRHGERGGVVDEPSVVRDAIGLVRRRLAVAEQVYFHPARMAASSMLVSAVHSARLRPMDLWGRSDADVLQALATSSDARASSLGIKLTQRRLFKPVYRTSRRSEENGHRTRILGSDDQTYSRYRRPDLRAALVGRLERLIGMVLQGDPAKGIGSIVISCPDRDTELDALDTLVLARPEAEVGRLQDTENAATRAEIGALREGYRQLWRLEVQIDPTIVAIEADDEFARRLAGALAKEIGLDNEIGTFAHVPPVDLGEWENEVSIDWALRRLGVADVITRVHHRELLGRAARKGEDVLGEVRNFVKASGYAVSDA